MYKQSIQLTARDTTAECLLKTYLSHFRILRIIYHSRNSVYRKFYILPQYFQYNRENIASYVIVICDSATNRAEFFVCVVSVQTFLHLLPSPDDEKFKVLREPASQCRQNGTNTSRTVLVRKKGGMPEYLLVVEVGGKLLLPTGIRLPI